MLREQHGQPRSDPRRSSHCDRLAAQAQLQRPADHALAETISAPWQPQPQLGVAQLLMPPRQVHQQRARLATDAPP